MKKSKGIVWLIAFVVILSSITTVAAKNDKNDGFTLGEFTSMYYEVLSQEVVDGTAIPCFPPEEFDWIVVNNNVLDPDTFGIFEFNMPVHVESFTANISNNDFSEVAQSTGLAPNWLKSYLKYRIDFTISGSADASYAGYSFELGCVTTYGNGGSIAVTINPDGTFAGESYLMTNCSVNELIFTSASLDAPLP